jgi:diketogulonate reductase-like aldo/keto reductase
VLPKSTRPDRIATHADVYDFNLTAEQMRALDGLDENVVPAGIEAPSSEPGRNPDSTAGWKSG